MSKDKRAENNNLQGDIWTEDDDVLLAETILRNVRKGKTVVDACKEMEEISEGRRTASASKFRWFTKLVEQYKAGYELAKTEGKKVKDAKKRKSNKGERYEEIVQEVFKEENAVEKEIEPEDFVILAKKFKEQQDIKKSEQGNHEKELKELRGKNEKLDKGLKEAKKEIEMYVEMLQAKQNDYNKVINALQTLKDLGMQITIPEPESPKYVVDKNGVVSKKD